MHKKERLQKIKEDLERTTEKVNKLCELAEYDNSEVEFANICIKLSSVLSALKQETLDSLNTLYVRVDGL